MAKRLFIVSNRLPIQIEKNNDKLDTRLSSGGLVSAINSYLGSDVSASYDAVYWAGMPCCKPAEWDEVVAALPGSDFTYLPVFFDKKNYERYYNGFSNSSVWPLFHYFPSFAEYDRDNYSSYQKANAAFADALSAQLRPGDVVWIHDYHLMPLAAMLRQVMPGLTIGFFLHIPFPCFEVFRLLPKQWQHDILSGILGADLVGFHTIDYATHFLKCVEMVLGYENDMHIIRYQDRLVKADVFPISIDFAKFNNAFDDQRVADMRNDLKKRFPGKRLIFSVDRLDYTKGVSHRVEGYRRFLERNPEYREQVVFVMVIVPSREYIPKYAERKKLIDELIGNVNSKIGTLHWQPVIYQYSSLTFEEMLALYTACDIALITPLRDGMNLVAKEFVASRKDKRGVLLLSEMTGAARELTSAIHLNPNDVEEIAANILLGFEMPAAEQEQRMEAMQARISNYNVNTWAADFTAQLDIVKTKQKEFQVRFIDTRDQRKMVSGYLAAKKRLFLLDYDGTLADFSNSPEKVKPGGHVRGLLSALAQDPFNEVYLVSGRKGEFLEKWFGDLPVHLVSEHGAKIRMANGHWQTLVQPRNEWKPQVMGVMEQYVKRCANTFVEEKDYCMVWHYRKADSEQVKLRVRELVAELQEYARSLGLQVVMGSKIVEVRVTGADKGTITRNHILPGKWDFIFAAGDDKTDEDMFRVLCGITYAFTVKIGPEASFARYNLLTPLSLVSLLESLVRSADDHSPVTQMRHTLQEEEPSANNA